MTKDFDAFKLLAHDRTEPDFAIFMATVGKAANHDGHLGTRTPFQMPSHQVGSDIASRSVVNAEIGRTGGQLKVRNKSHYAFSALPKAFQFVDNRRNVLADYGKSIQSARPTFDHFNHFLIGGSAQAFDCSASRDSGKSSDKGVEDKRLLVTESEFTRPLRSMARSTNTLSTVLRNAWDSKEGQLRTMTKSSPARASRAHISTIGHLTEEELDRELPECACFNGFANRFLWVEVERSKILPDGGKLDSELLAQSAEKLGEALASAAEVEEMTRDDEAQAL